MDGRAALITGAGSGIGRGLALALARRGVSVTLCDVDAAAVERVAGELRASGGRALAVRCDVSDPAQHMAAFMAHMQRWGRLDYALLNAGIGERGDLIAGRGDGWQQVLDIDLRAVMEGCRLAARTMLSGSPEGAVSSRAGGGSGSGSGSGASGSGTQIDAPCIMITASAGGTFPMPLSPVYAASKAACIQLTRSLAGPLAQRGIRICALCPQFTDTPLVAGIKESDPEAIATLMGGAQGTPLLNVEQVTAAGMELLTNGSRVGTCLVVLMGGAWAEPARTRFVPVEQPPAVAAAEARADPALAAWAAQRASSTRLIEVHRLSTDFRAATRLISRPLPAALPPGAVLVRRLWSGINASDVNYSAGRYFGSEKAAAARLPFPAGFEAVGCVAATGPGVEGLAAGQPCATMTYGGFAEWAVVEAKHVFPVPEARPEMVALLTSGLTASIALDQAGLRKGQTVLVTAAAGGTGQLAVQLAAAAGCHVIGTCSSGDKAALLRSLGCHRVVDYKTEDLKAVLKAEYSRGLDLVYEAVGGTMFDVALDALAPRGKLLVIGMMSQYGTGWQDRQYPRLAEKLLWKSASVQGFFLLHYAHLWRRHLARLARLLQAGRLRVQMDPRRFVGLEAVPDAVEWLQSGRSVGKVAVQLVSELPAGLARPSGGVASRL